MVLMDHNLTINVSRVSISRVDIVNATSRSPQKRFEILAEFVGHLAIWYVRFWKKMLRKPRVGGG